MLPKVRESLIAAIGKDMEDREINWGKMPKAKVKSTWKNEKGESIPMGWGSLWKVCKDDSYNMQPKKLKKLLGYYNIPHAENYGIVNLLNIGENEQ